VLEVHRIDRTSSHRSSGRQSYLGQNAAIDLGLRGIENIANRTKVTAIGNPDLGHISSTATSQKQIQFGSKLVFWVVRLGVFEAAAVGDPQHGSDRG
jgi:hypothetical protein